MKFVHEITSRRNAQVVGLADIANVQAKFEVGDWNGKSFSDSENVSASPPKAANCCLSHRSASFWIRYWQQNGSRKVAHDIGAQNSECGERAGKDRKQDATHFERFRQVAGVQAAGAAECNERVFARVVAAFDGNQPDGALDDCVRHGENSLRKGFDVAKISLYFLKFASGTIQIASSKPAIEQATAAEVTEHCVSICHRRLSAAAVADRTRIGARTFRADAQRSTCVKSCDRAAARTHSMNSQASVQRSADPRRATRW